MYIPRPIHKHAHTYTNAFFHKRLFSVLVHAVTSSSTTTRLIRVRNTDIHPLGSIPEQWRFWLRLRCANAKHCKLRRGLSTML